MTPTEGETPPDKPGVLPETAVDGQLCELSGDPDQGLALQDALVNVSAPNKRPSLD